MENYKKRFLKYMTDLGIEIETAEAELEGQLEMAGWDCCLLRSEREERSFCVARKIYPSSGPP